MIFIYFPGNISATSCELGIDRKRIREWSKSESELANTPQKKRRRFVGAGRSAAHPQLEKELLTWVEEQRNAKLVVNYRRLREHAHEIAQNQKIDLENFKCSDKWISNFMRRNRLSVRKITHMGQADNKTTEEKMSVAKEYLDTIPAVTTDLENDQIFNMDETPVYIDMLSSTTVDFIGNKNVDASHCGATKARLTVVLCASAAGQILRTMVILKGLKRIPNVKVPRGIFLTVANKGSMTYELMLTWINSVFAMRTSNLFCQKKSALFMDECTAHKKSEVMDALKKRKTTVKLIPPKTTSYLQPLDVSVNAPFKTVLRRQWEDWFANGEKEYTKSGYRRKPSYQQIVDFVAEAVASIKPESVVRSFECCGISARGQHVPNDELNSRLRSVLHCKKADIDDADEDESEHSEKER